MLKFKTGDKIFHISQIRKTEKFIIIQFLLIILNSIVLIFIPGIVRSSIVLGFYVIMILSLVIGTYCWKKHYKILKENI